MNIRLTIISIALSSSLLFAGRAQPTVFDIVGDSASSAINPDFPDPYGWAQMLFGEGGDNLPDPVDDTIFKLWPDIQVHNSAVSGSTASQWAVANSQLLQVVLDNEPDLVVMMIGGNDFLWAVRDGAIDDNDILAYRGWMTTIIDQLQALPSSPEIFIIDYYDLFDGESENLPGQLAGFRGMSDGVIRTSEVLADIASDEGCRFITIREDFMHHCYGRYIGDENPEEPPFVDLPATNFDIHPVTAGYRVMHRIIYDALRDMANEEPLSGVMIE